MTDPSVLPPCRVCARYSGHAKVTLNGAALETSTPGNYDATLVCHDVPYLPAGLLPLSVQFASGPSDLNNVFQLWIIPVKSVTQVSDPVRLCVGVIRRVVCVRHL